MMLNSCIFIFGPIMVWAAIYGPDNLASMVFGIFGSSPHANLASVPVGMRAK